MAKRYQRGNQRHKYKDRQYNGQKIRGINRRTDNTMAKRYQRGNQRHKYKDRQYNDQKIPKR